MGYGTVLFRHTVTHTPYLGETGVGPTFGTPKTVRGRLRLERKVLRSSRGDEVVADAVLICRPTETFSEGDKVTAEGRDFRVYEIQPGYGPHSGVNHLTVWLRAD